MQIHELCSKLPEIEGEQFEQLKNDIKARGLIHPILVYKRKIIDGKNRLRVLQELNITPTFQNGMLKKWEGNGSLKGLIVSLNILRRHLTASQRAAYALDFLEGYQKAAKKRQGQRKDLTSDKKLPDVQRAKDMAAKDFDTNRQYINDAEKIKEEAPIIFQKIKSGETTISHAKRELKNTKKLKSKELKPEKRKCQYCLNIRGFKRYGKRETTLYDSENNFATITEALDAGMKKVMEYAVSKNYDGHIWLNIQAKIESVKGSWYSFQNIYYRKYECKNKELAILDENKTKHYISEIKNKIKEKQFEIKSYEYIIEELLHENEFPEPTEHKKDDYDISRLPQPKQGIIIYQYPDGSKTEIKATVFNKEELEKTMIDKMPKDFDRINGTICTAGGL